MPGEMIRCDEHKEHDHRIVVLEKKTEDIERNIDGLGGKVNKIDKDFAVTKESITQSLAALSKLPDTLVKTQETLSEMRLTMVEMQHNLAENSKSVEALASQVSGLNDKINSVDRRVNDVNEKAKFDWMDYIKKNWPLIGFALLAAIAWAGDKVSKFVG